MSAEPSIPILVTGRGEQIGRMVVETMKPEYEGEDEFPVKSPTFRVPNTL